MLWIFLFTAGLILYGSLFPWTFRPHPYLPLGEALYRSLPAHLDRWVFKDALVNFMLYVPLGLTGALALLRRGWRGWLIPIAAGCLLSAGIEYAQLYTAMRTTSVVDFACNVAGTICGTILGHATRLTHVRVSRRKDILLLVALFAAWQFFPYLPIQGRTALRAKMYGLAAFSWIDLFVTFVAWTAAAVGLREIAGPKRVWWLLVILPARLLVSGAGVTASAVIGAIAAVATVSWTAAVRMASALGGAFVLIFVELAPFSFSRAARPFVWTPFLSLLTDDWIHGWLVLLSKFYLYAAVIWLVRRSGVHLAIATAGVASLLLVLESAQRYQPWHIPETTDSVLAIVAGVLFAALTRRTPDHQSRIALS